MARICASAVISRKVTTVDTVRSFGLRGAKRALALGFDRQVGIAAPFGPGAVIERMVVVTDERQTERQYGGGDARAAARHDRSREVDAGAAEGGPDVLLRFQRAVGIEQRGVVDIAGARNVAAANAGPRLRLLGAETRATPRVGDRRGRGAGDRRHLALVAHQHGVEAGREVALLAWLRFTLLERAALRLPFRKPAIEHRDILMAEDPEHPPGAG